MERRYSNRFAILLLSIHCVLGYAIFVLPVAPVYRSVALFMVLLNLFLQWRSQLRFQTRKAIYGFEYLGDGQWQLDCADGTHPAALAPSSLVSAWLLVLGFVIDDKQTRWVYLFNDSAERSSLRRLRMLLRLTPRLLGSN